MLLPTGLFSTVSLLTAKAGQVLLALDRARALIWILKSDGSPFAVFLTGEYAGRGFEIDRNSVGFGLGLDPIEVRLDPNSVGSEGGPWRLRAQDGALSLQFEAQRDGGLPDRRWASVASIATEPGATVFFSNWAIGVEVDLEWEEILSVIDGKVTATLQ